MKFAVFAMLFVTIGNVVESKYSVMPSFSKTGNKLFNSFGSKFSSNIGKIANNIGSISRKEFKAIATKGPVGFGGFAGSKPIAKIPIGKSSSAAIGASINKISSKAPIGFAGGECGIAGGDCGVSAVKGNILNKPISNNAAINSIPNDIGIKNPNIGNKFIGNKPNIGFDAFENPGIKPSINKINSASIGNIVESEIASNPIGFIH